MALGDSDDPFDLIVIGRGSAAAYFLQSMPTRYKSFKDSKPVDLSILVIGEADPWAGARGYVKGTYGQNINQAKQVLGRSTGSTAPISQGPQDRQEWANENEQILAAIANEVVTGIVTKVSKTGKLTVTDPQVFKVEARSTPKAEYFARKIVIATGGGIESPDNGHKDYHAVIPEVQAVINSPAVMNLDAFMKKPRHEHKTSNKIAILGPTAGTDAVMQAGTLGYSAANTYWLMRSKPNTGGFLNVYPGNDGPSRQQITNIIESSKKRILAYTDTTLKLTAQSNQIQIACDPVSDSPLKDKQVLVDVFVYSTGQTASNTLTAPPTDPTAKASAILDGSLMALLEPIYDVNQRLARQGDSNSSPHSSGPWQHVTGVQLQDSNSESGLMIIGAASFQVAAKMDHNFLQFEFNTLQTALKQYPGFTNSARSCYPELLTTLKLSQVPRVGRSECKMKQQAFISNWNAFLSDGSRKFELQGQVAVGDRTRWIQDRIKDANHLCYLFQQRTQAAQYLYDEVGGTERSVQSMLNAANTLPKALQDCRLLAGINANVSSINASSPKALAKKTDLNKLDFQVNFLESATELRCYMSAHYPNISEAKAQDFIRNVTTRRQSKGNMGFELYEIVDFELELETLNKKARSRGASRT